MTVRGRLAVLAAALALASCSVSPDDTVQAVGAYGFTDVKLGGISAFGCSDRDTFTRVFTATVRITGAAR